MRKIAHIVAVVILAATLGGCAAQIISSTPRSVIVRAPAMKVGDAQALAESECMKRGLHARMNSKPQPTQFAFDCVP